jgi:hypothetical protein
LSGLLVAWGAVEPTVLPLRVSVPSPTTTAVAMWTTMNAGQRWLTIVGVVGLTTMTAVIIGLVRDDQPRGGVRRRLATLRASAWVPATTDLVMTGLTVLTAALAVVVAVLLWIGT